MPSSPTVKITFCFGDHWTGEIKFFSSDTKPNSVSQIYRLQRFLCVSCRSKVAYGSTGRATLARYHLTAPCVTQPRNLCCYNWILCLFQGWVETLAGCLIQQSTGWLPASLDPSHAQCGSIYTNLPKACFWGGGRCWLHFLLFFSQALALVWPILISQHYSNRKNTKRYDNNILCFSDWSNFVRSKSAMPELRPGGEDSLRCPDLGLVSSVRRGL